MLPFIVLLVVRGVPIANPLAFGGRAAPEARAAFDPARPRITAVSRHPLTLDIVLWAAAQVVPNGDAAHRLLFGLLALIGVVGMAVLDRRRRRQCGPQAFAALADNPALLGLPGGGSRAWREAFPRLRVAVAALGCRAIPVLHQLLFGVSPPPPP